MRRGKITVTTPTRTRRDGSTHSAGPYYKVQRWENGANRTTYLTAEQHAELKPDIDNYRTFRGLCDRLAEVNEALTLAGHVPPAKKKRRTKAASGGRASRKPKPSSGGSPKA